MAASMPPDFRQPSVLVQHIHNVLGFYVPRCVGSSPGIGFLHSFADDGRVVDAETRHLVSSTRYIVQFSWAIMHADMLCEGRASPEGSALQFTDIYKNLVARGVQFLRDHHRNAKTGGYKWTVNLVTGESDATNHNYGLAFVTLAYATAIRAGFTEYKEHLDETWDVMTKYFWEEEYGLYADEASPDFSVIGDYRGQNSNMHSVEAHIAAYEATSEMRHLDRARIIAKNMCVRQCERVKASTGVALVYEHYVRDWSAPDLEYNRSDPKHIFRPWGFQPGHLIEWAKLLMTLYRIDASLGSSDVDWYVSTAVYFFDSAMKYGWDEKHGGLYYSLTPDEHLLPCDDDKYKWVQAEGIATAALLAQYFSDKDEEKCSKYWDTYTRLWEYAWKHFVDHDYGAWYRILTRANEKYDNYKSPPGKVDYHVTGACYECLQVLSPAASALK